MSRPVSSRIGIAPPETPANESETRLYGWRLATARALVYTIIAIALGLCVLSLPGLLPRLATSCAEPLDGCMLSPQQVAQLAQLGVTPGAVAIGIAALSWLAVLLGGGVATVLLWRRTDDWMALLVALELVLMPVGFMPILMGLASNGVWNLPASVLSSAGIFMLFLLAALFPSGSFVPRWLWLPIVVEAWIIFGPSNLTDLLGPFAVPLELTATLSVIGGQIYRYRHSSTPVQRQQTKWAVSGLVAAIVLNQAFWQPAAWGLVPQPLDSLYTLLFTPDSFLMVGAVAICFGVAILRYRLYDIDVLIRRTLIYGTLTAILAGVYLALVLGAQAASHALTGQRGDKPIVIVASTLLIAALFQPLRRHIQRMIDRRFYRAKYDAAKTIEHFAATLQQQVEFDQLREHLVEAVEETMQPVHVSLWLSSSSGRHEQPARPDSSAIPRGEMP